MKDMTYLELLNGCRMTKYTQNPIASMPSITSIIFINVERVDRIELSSLGWKPKVMPLYDTRKRAWRKEGFGFTFNRHQQTTCLGVASVLRPSLVRLVWHLLSLSGRCLGTIPDEKHYHHLLQWLFCHFLPHLYAYRQVPLSIISDILSSVKSFLSIIMGMMSIPMMIVWMMSMPMVVITPTIMYMVTMLF